MSGPLGRLEHRLDGCVGRVELGSEAALVADACREATFMQHALEGVEDLDADPESLRE